ncbi:MAG: hypothetical protein ACT6FC_02580 [Methanosarcinaceae archaeon]
MIGKSVDISSLERKDLIAGVIAKHKRFIDEYNGEFNELDGKVTSLGEQAESAKKNREYVIERLDVLKEKRHQLYHQAENLLGDLSSFDEIQTDDNKLIHSIYNEIVRIKPSITLENEMQIVNEIKDKLSRMSHDNQDFQKLVSQIRSKVDDALASSIELDSITGSDKESNDLFFKLNDELKQVVPRHGWLKNRIESHKAGLKYWEDTASGKVVTTGEAVES